MQNLAFMFVPVAAYFLGSIPTGYLTGRARGIDVRTLGSGNIGATNVFRHLGKTAGVFVLVADALKGYLACTVLIRWAGWMAGPGFDPVTREQLAVMGGIAAILGHNYTCWLRFKGGKGIATSAGVLLALMPIGFAAALSAWLVMFAASRYVSLASVSAAVVLPFAVWLAHGSRLMITVAVALSAMAIYKHKGNIQRLLNGTEPRVGSKKAQPSAPSAG